MTNETKPAAGVQIAMNLRAVDNFKRAYNTYKWADEEVSSAEGVLQSALLDRAEARKKLDEAVKAFNDLTGQSVTVDELKKAFEQLSEEQR